MKKSSEKLSLQKKPFERLPIVEKRKSDFNEIGLKKPNQSIKQMLNFSLGPGTYDVKYNDPAFPRPM